MDDLVARLRVEQDAGWYCIGEVFKEAADEIERLRAENAALRAVMRNVIDWSDDYIEIKLREEMGAG